MNETKVLIEKITEGIQEKKGKNIVIADLTNIDDTMQILCNLSGELSQPGHCHCRFHKRIYPQRCRHQTLCH